MKNAFLILTIAIVACGCNRKTDTVRDFIPGTYVNSAQGEMGRANDTLVITLVNGNDYALIRRTGYQAIRAGHLLPVKHRVQKLSGVYDPARAVLDETTNGRLICFDTGKRSLTVNQATYRKL